MLAKERVERNERERRERKEGTNRHTRVINPLEISGNYMKLLHWLLMGGLLHLLQQGGDWAGLQPAQAPLRCTNVTAHPSTASVAITVLLYNGPLMCGLKD